MGKTKGLYKIEFPVGSKVQIADEATLEEFYATWKYHHKLELHQLAFHDQIEVVEEASFYHGGDELYRLSGIIGIWHEQCLHRAPQEE